jgi:hypothetical protein
VRHGSHDHPVKPKGYRKAKSRLRIARQPVYLPIKDDATTEAAIWNMADGRSRTDARVGI